MIERAAFKGFSKPVAIAAAPKPNQRYLAYMLPTQTQGVGDFGPYVRCEYNVFVFDEAIQQHRRYTVSELWTLPENPSTQDKIVQRLAAIQNVPLEQTDLSGAMEGYCYVTLYRPDGENFNRIGKVEPFPPGLEIPLDIATDPASKAMVESFSSEPPF